MNYKWLIGVTLGIFFVVVLAFGVVGANRTTLNVNESINILVSESGVSEEEGECIVSALEESELSVDLLSGWSSLTASELDAIRVLAAKCRAQE